MKMKRIQGRLGVVSLVISAVFRKAGGADESGKFPGFLAEIERALISVPRRIGATERAGPFQLKISQEAGFDFQREFGFDLEENNCAGLVHRNKKGFAHGESVSGVDNCP